MQEFNRFAETAAATALRWHQEGAGAVLATVVQTWGSAPRRVGDGALGGASFEIRLPVTREEAT